MCLGKDRRRHAERYFSKIAYYFDTMNLAEIGKFGYKGAQKNQDEFRRDGKHALLLGPRSHDYRDYQENSDADAGDEKSHQVGVVDVGDDADEGFDEFASPGVTGNGQSKDVLHLRGEDVKRGTDKEPADKIISEKNGHAT